MESIIAVQIFPKTFIWVLEILKPTELTFKILWIFMSRLILSFLFFFLSQSDAKTMSCFNRKIFPENYEIGATKTSMQH